MRIILDSGMENEEWRIGTTGGGGCGEAKLQTEIAPVIMERSEYIALSQSCQELLVQLQQLGGEVARANQS